MCSLRNFQGEELHVWWIHIFARKNGSSFYFSNVIQNPLLAFFCTHFDTRDRYSISSFFWKLSICLFNCKSSKKWLLHTCIFILRWNTRQDKFFSVLTSIKIFRGAANHLKTITIVFVQLLFKKILLINILRALNIIPIQLNFFHKTNLSTNSSPNMSMFHNSADEITLLEFSKAPLL